MNIFVSWSVDHLDGLIATALMSDNIEELRHISSNIKRAVENVKAWAMAVGGSPILDIGPMGSVQVPADRMTELPAIAQKFEDLCEGTLSIGVGMSLSESHTAMRYSAMIGGNQISLYHDEMEQKLDEAGQPNPEDALLGLKKNSVVGTEDPVGFADGPSESDGGAPPPPDPQHGGAQPAEMHSAGPAPQQAPPPEMSGMQQDPNGGQVESEDGGEGEGQDPRTVVVQALMQIKQQAPVLEQMKETNPDAFEAVKNVVQAMILMAQGMSAEGEAAEGTEGDGESESSGGGEDTQKSENDGAKILPFPGSTKKPESPGNCSSCNHKLLPSGKCSKMLNHDCDDPTADRKYGKLEVVKEELDKASLPMPDPRPHKPHHVFPVGTAKDGAVKVTHKDLETRAPQGDGWHSVRAGQVLSEDGHAVSSRNPGGK